jgi:hypothetical protein
MVTSSSANRTSPANNPDNQLKSSCVSLWPVEAEIRKLVSPTTRPIHVTRANRLQGLYYYLGSVVDLNDDPEVHFKYIQAAKDPMMTVHGIQINREKNENKTNLS